MSTKIYQAFRCPASKWPDFIDWARGKLLVEAVKQTEKLMFHVDVPPDPPPKTVRSAAGWRQRQRLKGVIKEAARAAESPYHDPFDLACGLNIWFHKGKVYAVPIGPEVIVRALNDDLPDWVEDYCYYNNADPPEDVSARAWRQREKNWEEVCLDIDHNARRLYHEVVDFRNMGSFVLEQAVNARILERFPPGEVVE